MKNTVWSFIGIVVVVILLFAAGRFASAPGSSGENSAAAALSSDSNTYDFGEISMSRGTVSKSFTLSNSTAAPVRISKIFTSCMCTTAILKTPSGERGPFGMPGHGTVPAISEDIPSGGSRELVVTFDPAAHGPAGIGRIERTVSVIEGGGGAVEFTIRAAVTP
jgi:hypothetical protein